MADAAVLERFRVRVTGPPTGPAIVFAHGLGCDQIMWRHVAPGFEDRYRVVRFDHVGHGGADRGAYDPERHASLDGYAEDLLAVLDALELWRVVYVGHSVSALIGLLAAGRAPERFRALALVAASARYVHDEDYRGAFTAEEVEALLAAIDRSWEQWSSEMTPAILGEHYREDLAAQLTFSFCRTDPEIIKTFARATFLADVRDRLATVTQPCLVLQCARDAMAPPHAGQYLVDRLPRAEMAIIEADGHMPHVTVPRETGDHLAAFVSSVA